MPCCLLTFLLMDVSSSSVLVFEKKSFRTEDAKGAVALHDPVRAVRRVRILWLESPHVDRLGAGLLEQGAATTENNMPEPRSEISRLSK